MVITSLKAFRDGCASLANGQLVAADVETKGSDPGEGTLLGVALSWKGQPGLYVPLSHWSHADGKCLPVAPPELSAALKDLLLSHPLVGWNIEYDRFWLDAFTGGKTTWRADVRCMWYLLDREQVERGYSLKSAQKTLLGWHESNAKELEEYVTRLGGKLSNGDHYLAPLHILGKYAALDTQSTWECYELLAPEMDRLAYWDYLEWLQTYGTFLTETTRQGTAVDHTQLARARNHYVKELDRLNDQLREVCAKEIAEIEAVWHQAKIKDYVMEHAKQAYLANPDRWERFNVRSGPQKAKLFHEKLGFPVLETTAKGAPKTDRATYERINHPAARLMMRLSEVEKSREFADGYLEHVVNGRIHFPHNWCGTVTGRLAGFAPQDLNMPFSEEPITRAFYIEKGWTGLHMDFKALEPTVIAAFSQDPSLLRLYRDGVGDVYLDLALELFPLAEADQYGAENAALIRRLHATYDPHVKTPSAVKDGVKPLRDVAKIVQLAVGYTGTKYTVSENLTKAGFPTSLYQAGVFVNRYWSKYVAVKQFEERLQSLYDKQGYIRSVAGAYIWVPDKYRKDLMNRFVQRSGHEILVSFIKELYALVDARGLSLRPVLPDIHDSHSAKCLAGEVAACEQAFHDALASINAQLSFPVTLGMELKQFNTFYGLKNVER